MNYNHYKILYVEDHPELRKQVRRFLEMEGFTVVLGENGLHGLEQFQREQPDLVISDYRMPLMDGVEMVREMKMIVPDLPVIVLTAFNEAESLIEMINVGVDQYISKPIDTDLLLKKVNRILEPLDQRRKIARLRQKIVNSYDFMLGRSKQMREIIHNVQKIAETNCAILVEGETGVGKSYLARVIHNMSDRNQGPFVVVDANTIPENLIESELFGYARGAFTGAHQYKKGFFETASGGTLFLDDLENLPLYIQGKILRAVDEKEIYPIGSTEPVKLDIRLITATNRNINYAIKEGNFRQDLFYRLNEYKIYIPPLRERPEDIVFFAEKFLTELIEEFKGENRYFAPETYEHLKKQLFPGNLRELRSVIKQAILFSTGRMITPDQITLNFQESLLESDQVDDDYTLKLESFDLDQIEQQVIKKVLKITGGKRMRAANMMNMTYARFKRKLAKYNLPID